VTPGDETTKKARTQSATEFDLILTGIRYAEVRADPGEKICLIREPDNQYDANAVRVENATGKKLGHVKREQVAVLAPLLDRLSGPFEGVTTNYGDGWMQNLHFRLTAENNEQDGVFLG
jgi:hypothetical protein